MSLEARAVTAGHGRGPDVLSEVSLTVARGEMLGLTGPSGSGKSTLARVLALMLEPRSGSVRLDGTQVRGVGHSVPARLRAQVAMLYQSPREATDPRMALASIIEQPARIARSRVDVDELAHRVGLTPDLLTRRPHQVSDGQLQRACVARALAQAPRYLICDEPTAMLDASTTASIARLIQEHALGFDVGVVFISHDVELLDVVCSRTQSVHRLE